MSAGNSATIGLDVAKTRPVEDGRDAPKPKDRKRIVVVGLGMVGIAFM